MTVEIETGKFYYETHQVTRLVTMTIRKPDDSILCHMPNTEENIVYAEIMVDALNAALENLTPANETPVAVVEI